MRRLALAVVALAVGTVAWPAGQAPAATPDALVIRRVDSTRFPQVEILVRRNSAEAAELTVAEQGKQVPAQARAFDRPGDRSALVLVIDNSLSVDTRNGLSVVKQAVGAFITNAPPSQRIGLITTGPQSVVISSMTADRGRLQTALNDLKPSDESARILDAMQTAAAMIGDDTPPAQGVAGDVVLVTDSPDDGSTATADEVRSTALVNNVALSTVLLNAPKLDPALVDDLARSTGGRTIGPVAAGDLVNAVTAFQRVIDGSQLLTYTSARQPGEVLELEVRSGPLRATSVVNPNTLVMADSTQSRIVAKPGIPLLSGAFGKWFGLLAALVASSLGAYGVLLLVLRDRPDLTASLQPYASPDDTVASDSLAETRLVQRAVELTEQIAERQGLLPRLERALEDADLPLRASEALFFYIAATAIATTLALLLSGRFLVGFLALFVLLLLPPAVISGMVRRRRRKFLELLPGALQLLAGSMRAGYSLVQGLEAVAQEVSEPVGAELRRVIGESRLGRPLEDALQDAADRVNSRDFTWAVMAIRIQREVGGNLAELLDTVSETMVSREQLRREVRSLTAEGRISAYVLGLLPIVMGIAFYLLNPEYLDPLFDETVGNFFLAGSVVLVVVGFVWMIKTIEIEV